MNARTAFLVLIIESGVGQTAPNGIAPNQLPQGVETFTVQLTAFQSEAGNSPGYLVHRSPQQASELEDLPAAITQEYDDKDYAAFEFARLPDGTRYVTVLDEVSELKMLNRQDSRWWHARLYRIGDGGDADLELLREGVQFEGNDVTLPVEIPLPGIGASGLMSFRTEIGYSVNGSGNGRLMVTTGRGTALQVSGSIIRSEGKVSLTVMVPDQLSVTPETGVSLQFEPIHQGLPQRSATGKLHDLLDLGSARVAVTSIEPDFSQATVAVLAGSLEETLREQLHLGERLPPFSQVELTTRKSVTREDVLARSDDSAPIAFIFGDLAPSGDRTGPYRGPQGPGGAASLPLPPAEVAEQVGLELEPKPIVIFVTRQIPLDFLYTQLRNQNPDYLVLTDFVDPLWTTFVPARSGPMGYYGGRMPGTVEPSLRQVFNLPENSLSLVGFDPDGKVLYLKTDATTDFLASLAELRAALAQQ